MVTADNIVVYLNCDNKLPNGQGVKQQTSVGYDLNTDNKS
jgi:hypothetical protein